MDTMKDTKMQPATDAVIEELRKVIADCYWPTSPVTINELLNRLEAAEKERDALRTENAALVEDMNLLRNNNMTLRAKIEQMEKQVPVGDIQRANSTGNYICSEVWVPLPVGAKLYALPGAKGE